MSLDPYASCPCGSGKKFKWCCHAIHERIERADRLDEDGQHEAALRLIEEVVQENPTNPEAWGRKARLLYQNDRAEEAEKALDEALKVNPNYPYGLYMRGLFRQFEGEIAGSLLLFRRAAEAYDPQAKQILAEIQARIFECEMKLQHPIAARLALEKAYSLAPTEELRSGLHGIFGEENPKLPAAARKEYAFLPSAAGASPERRSRWEQALSKAATGKLTDAVSGFGQLLQEDENDAAAWYDLGLCQAWQGHNKAAVEALSRYVALEGDEERAAQAWTLAEVLRCGQGVEDQADWVEHSAVMPLSNPQAFVNHLGELQKEEILLAPRVDEEQGILQAVLAEKPGPALTAEQEARQHLRLGAYLILIGNVLRLWNVDRSALERTVQRLQDKLGQVLGPVHKAEGPARYHDVLSGALIFPKGVSDEATFENTIRAHLENYFEETWLQQPLKGMDGNSPIDAAGHPVLRKKLRGTVAFLEECAALSRYPYDFDRLRRKLGLQEGGPAAAPTPGGEANIAAMGAPELAGLAAESLSDSQLDLAFRTALQVDAKELAGNFAAVLTERPPQPDSPDRWALFHHLIQQSVSRGDLDAALSHLEAGQKHDCEHNEGRRRNDYELRRGQLHARRGDIEQAQDVFDRLIARVPDELKVRGSAVEAMLSARQGKRALGYAEAALEKARQRNDRDMEGYFLELSEAARKQG